MKQLPYLISKVFLFANQILIRRKILGKSFDSEQAVFEKIYRSRYWGTGETVSGSGSTLDYTKQVRAQLPKVVAQYKIDSIFDAPCGDYNWFKEIRWPSEIRYLGGDIVKDLIQINNQLYKSDRVEFLHFDIVNSIPPLIGKNTLWHCRDCLFHLPLDSIQKVLINFSKSELPFLMASSHYDVVENRDIQAGDFRVIDLHKPPFNLPTPLLQFDDFSKGAIPRFMGMWSREQVLSTFGG